jgi:hypothetical protein
MQNGRLPNDQSINVDATAVDIVSQLEPGVQRALINIVNTSTGGQVISISIGKDATPGAGIVLYPGGSLSEAIDAAFIPSNERYSAISSASGGSVALQERLG